MNRCVQRASILSKRTEGSPQRTRVTLPPITKRMLQQGVTPAMQSDNPAKDERFEKTLRFMRESVPPPAQLLDLGAPNPLSELMGKAGYSVENTEGDLDDVPEVVRGIQAEAATAFEILEHLVAPLNVLREIEAPRLFASVPLRLWFATAYWNQDDPWDRHYHEFEPRQFNWLLDKAGWDIVRTEKWTPRVDAVLGVRPWLRRITPRWYVVEAQRR